VADAVARDIDRNGDGVWSQAEQRSYAQRILDQLEVRVDGQPLRGRIGTTRFPVPERVRSGDGTIGLELLIDVPALAEGAHQLYFRNGNGSNQEGYLANALVPDDERVTIKNQRRDGSQRELTIDFAVSAAASPFTTWGAAVVAGLALLAAAVVRASRTLHPPVSSQRSAVSS